MPSIARPPGGASAIIQRMPTRTADGKAPTLRFPLPWTAVPAALHERLDRWLFRLVLLTFVASILFASAPLPLGGPNVLLAGAAIGVLLLRMAAKGYAEVHRGFAPFLLCGLLMMAWAAWVHLATGTMGTTRIGRMGIGLGIAAATCAAVTAGNVRLLLYAIVLSVLASVSFGLALLQWPDTLGPIWRTVATVDESAITPVFSHGRLAGIANSIDTLSSHLAMAIPITVGLWLRNIGRDPIKVGRVILLNLLLLFQAAAVVLMDRRSLAVALLFGGAAVLIGTLGYWPRAKMIRFARQAFWIAACLSVAGVLFVFKDDIARKVREAGPAPQAASEPAAGLPPAQRERSAPARSACMEDLGTLLPPVSIAGEWNGSCTPVHTTPRRSGYARYYSFVMARQAPLAIHAVTDANCCYLTLLPGKLPHPTTGPAGGPLKRNRLRADGGYLWVDLPAGEYTLAVVTHRRGRSRSFELELIFDLERKTSFDHRYRMFEVAYRYALEYPLGAGGFFPASRHLNDDMSAKLMLNFLEKQLHNHLLVVLSHYGLPGLALALLFYGCLFRSAFRSVALAGRSRNAYGIYLAATTAGILTTCFVYMLFAPAGPFYRSWHYFLAFGLVFGVERILSIERANGATTATNTRKWSV